MVHVLSLFMFSRGLFRHSNRRRATRIPVAVQPLEVRGLLAGNVLAVMKNGDLFLTGDSRANSVDVVAENGDVVVRGRDNTTINGSSALFKAVSGSATVPDDFFVRLGDGNDVLFVEGVSIAGRASVLAHAGSDRVGLHNTTVSGDLFIDTAAGNDIVNLDGVHAGRELSIRTGRNADTVRVVNSTVSGNTAVESGRHADTVVLDTVTASGHIRVGTGEGADKFVAMKSSVAQGLTADTGAGNDFLMLDSLSINGQTVVSTGGQSDRVAVKNASQFESLKISAGVGRDAVEVSADTVVRARRQVRGSEAAFVSSTDQDRNLNDPVSGALTRSTAAASFFTTLSTNTSPLPLAIDVSSNQTIQLSGTLVTSDPNFKLQVTTQPGATVAVDSDGDGQFNDGTATADSAGAASLNVSLVNNATNQGTHSLKVKASSGSAVPATKQVDVFLAEGTVVRFDTSMGKVDVALYDQDAPNTVAAFLKDLSRYDGSIIHRNVKDFIVQGGGIDVSGTTVQNVVSFPAPPNEFNLTTPRHSNLRGTLSTAQNSDINSFTGQWFINTINNDQTSPVNNLDSVPHTVFGKVIGTGMSVIDAINNTPVFNVSSLLTGSAASTMTNVPLVNYTTGSVPTAANFIKVNSVFQLTPAPSGNKFSAFENSAKGTVVGTVTSTVTGGSVIYDFADSARATQLNLHLDDHLEGPLNAPIVLFEYMSLQCPHCAEAQPVIAKLLADNPGNVLIVRRHLPLDSATGGFFDHGFEAALAAEAAGRQGKFDEMMTQLFSRQSEWTNAATAAQAKALFEDIAFNTLGLNSTQFNSDISDPALTARVNRDITDAGVLGATATPTFFLNGMLSTVVPTSASVQAALQTLNPAFALDRRSGALTVFNSAALDFEFKQSFPLNITAAGTSTASVSAVVNLIDIFAG